MTQNEMGKCIPNSQWRQTSEEEGPRCESEVANEDVAKVIGSNHPQTIMVEHEYVSKNWG
jgi:hypothetical protein